MRKTALVGGVVAGTLAIGVASAAAAPVPITIDVTGGTLKVGSLAGASTTETGRFAGTIDSQTFAASFPAGNSLPSVTIKNATVGVFTGDLKIASAPGAFTGQGTASGAGVSIDLSGPVDYTFTQGANSCTATAPAVSLTGKPIDLATGTYTAAGNSTSPIMNPASLAGSSAPFCVALQLRLVPTTTTTIAGKVTIPGLIPLPTVTTVPAPTTTTPTTPTAPPTTATPKPGKLAVTISKPKTVKRGSSTVTKVVVRNTGTGTARSVTVKLAASGTGVTPRSTTKTYSTIAAGKSRTFSVRLRTKKSSKKSSAVKVTAKGASGLSASKSTTLRLR